MPVPPNGPAGGGNPPSGGQDDSNEDSDYSFCMCCIEITHQPTGSATRNCIDLADSTFSQFIDPSKTPEEQCAGLLNVSAGNGMVVTEATFLGCPEENQDITPQEKCQLFCEGLPDNTICCNEEGDCLGVIREDGMTLQECLDAGGTNFPLNVHEGSECGNIVDPSTGKHINPCTPKCCIVSEPGLLDGWMLADMSAYGSSNGDRITWEVTFWSLPDPSKMNVHEVVYPTIPSSVTNNSSPAADVNITNVSHTAPGGTATTFPLPGGWMQTNNAYQPVTVTISGDAANPEDLPCDQWFLDISFEAVISIPPFAPVTKSAQFKLSASSQTSTIDEDILVYCPDSGSDGGGPTGPA